MIDYGIVFAATIGVIIGNIIILLSRYLFSKKMDKCVWTLAKAREREIEWMTYCRASFPYLKLGKNGVPIAYSFDYCPYCGQPMEISKLPLQDEDISP